VFIAKFYKGGSQNQSGLTTLVF